MKNLKTEIRDSKDSIYFKMTGDIKGIEAFNLKGEFKIYASKNKTLRIDLTEVSDISLTGLNAILMSKVYASKQNNEVILILSENSKLMKQLHLTKMMDQFTLEMAAEYRMAA